VSARRAGKKAIDAFGKNDGAKRFLAAQVHFIPLDIDWVKAVSAVRDRVL